MAGLDCECRLRRDGNGVKPFIRAQEMRRCTAICTIYTVKLKNQGKKLSATVFYAIITAAAAVRAAEDDRTIAPDLIKNPFSRLESAK